MKEFAWRPGARVSIDPNVAGKELERIHERDGTIRPQVVVDESQPKKAPLHPAFEWDDKLAANAHRCEQARLIVRSIRVIEDDEVDEAPLYVSVRVDPEESATYMATAVAVQNVDLFEQVLADTRAAIAALQARLARLEALCDEQRPGRARRVRRAAKAAALAAAALQ